MYQFNDIDVCNINGTYYKTIFVTNKGIINHFEMELKTYKFKTQPPIWVLLFENNVRYIQVSNLWYSASDEHTLLFCYN